MDFPLIDQVSFTGAAVLRKNSAYSHKAIN